MARVHGAFVLVLILVSAVFAGAQSPELSGVDFSDASVSLAGPRAFYLRNIATPEGRYAVRLASDGGDTWTVVEVYPEEDNILPQEVILDVATVQVTDDNAIEIDGVFLEDDVYSVRLRPVEDGYALVDGIRNGTLTDIDAERAEPLIDLVVEQVVATELEDARRRIEELRAARDEAQAKVHRLSAQNMGLIERNEDLEAENASLKETRDSLRRQVRELKAENDELRDDIADLQRELERAAAEEDTSGEDRRTGADAAREDGTATDRDAVVAGVDAAEVEAALAEIRTLAEAAKSIDEGLSGMDQAIRSLSDRASSGQQELLDAIESAQEGIAREIDRAVAAARAAAAPAAAADTTDDRDAADEDRAGADEDRDAAEDDREERPADRGTDAETEQTIRELRRRVADLQERRETVREEVLSQVIGGGYVDLMSEGLTTELAAGFDENGAAQIGSWSVTDGALVQRDPNQYFAKYLIEVPQSPRRTLYRFTAASLDEGWVGLGLHIFVSNVDKRGYGLGDSLLIWFTRDPSVYGTENTFLQVYRSSDDVDMGRVAGAMISEPIAEPLDAAVLYEPETGYLTVSVSGEDKIRYRAWFDVTRGVQIALRTLGRARFDDFTVHTAPAR